MIREHRVIRLATHADLAAIESIVAEAYQPWAELIGIRPKPMDDDYVARIAAAQVTVLTNPRDAARAGDVGSPGTSGGPGREVVVGLIVLVPEPDALLVDNVAVRPSHHGRGHGRVLLDFAEDQARLLGLPALRLYTNALMTQNIEHYQRRGYVITGDLHRNGRTVVFMRKELLHDSR
jgi:GNAT superfamily N-acetyltransferase